MYHKYLFVGLGGSGGKTLRFLKRDIKRWMKRNGQGEKVPQGWQFLHIDTPTNPDGNELNYLVPQLSKDEYLGLIDHGLTLNDVQTNLDGNTTLHPELEGWRIAPAAMPLSLSEGAGQFRAIGRTVAMWSASVIKNQLKDAFNSLEMANVESELKEIYQQVTGEIAEGSAKTHVIIVSSLAGGTGAGLLQDVCDIIRGLDNQVSDQIFGVLYTPEVFHSLGGEGTKGVQPNTLAALSEILNGYWWNGDPKASDANVVVPPIDDAVLKNAGLSSKITRSGPNYPFLVGRKGAGGIDYETPTKLFEMIGRSMLSWLTSPTVEDKFLAYTITNWHMAATGKSSAMDLLVNRGGDNEKGTPAIAGLGFGRLSVGTEYFEEYATQRVVRDAHSILKDYHDTSIDAKAIKDAYGVTDPYEVAELIAREHLNSFIVSANLAELGPKDNDIQDALIPSNVTELNQDLDTTVRRLLDLDNKDPQLAGEWVIEIRQAIDIAKKEYKENYRTALAAKTAEWVRDIENSIIVTAEKYLSLYGLLVAAKICSLLAHELQQAYKDDLTSDYERWWDWAEGPDGNNASNYGVRNLADLPGKISNDNEQLYSAVTDSCNNVKYVGSAFGAEKAIELCEQLAEKVFLPLHNALAAAHKQAELDWADSVGGSRDTAPPIASFVVWNDEAPPESVLPPAGEFTLIDPQEYPRLFMELIGEQTNKIMESEIKDGVQNAILSGKYIRDQEDVSLAETRELLVIKTTGGWNPSNSGGDSPPKKLMVDIQTDKNSLLRRAHHWLNTPGSPMGSMLDTSIRSYLGDDDNEMSPVEKEERKARFLAKFTAAVDSAAPLINLDTGVLNMVHPDSVAGNLQVRVFSEIPLDQHAVGEDVKSQLSALGIGSADLGEMFNMDANADHIDITTFTSAPLSPIVVSSLWGPIDDRYTEEVQTGSLQDFWQRRRSRTMQRFVPAPQSTIQAMIRGWITARYLGLVSEPKIMPNRGQLSISREGELLNASFPFPLLSDVYEAFDELPSVLESLGLAYMRVNTDTNLDHLAAYIRLRDLGTATGQPDLYSYKKLSPLLAQWVDEGTYPPSEKLIAEPRLQESGEQDRKADLILALTQWKDAYTSRYQQYHASVSGNPAALTPAPCWPGLANSIIYALEQMIEAAEAHGKAAGDSIG